MIRLIHRYKQSIAIVFMFIAFCFAVSGVGMSALDALGSKQQVVITVNDREITYPELMQQERNLRAEMDPRIAQFFPNFDLRQYAADSMITNAVLAEQVEKLGLTGSDEYVRRYLSRFSREQYIAKLRSLGLTPLQFEQRIREDMANNLLAEIIADTAIVTPQDIRNRFVERETKYTLSVARYDSANIVDAVPPPSDSALTSFYEAHATEYELAPRVSYEYVVLDSANFEKDVALAPQDVELYYSENTGKFSLPEEAKIRAVKLLYPKENDPKMMAAVKERAEKAHQEAVAGKPFEDVVRTYSDDIPSKVTGGARGWIVKGKGQKGFDDAVFSTPVGTVSKVIESDYGFEIVQVEEKKEARARPLDEVRQEIESQLRKVEAPAYAAAKGQELLAALRKSPQSLADLVAPLGLSVKRSSDLIDATTDPAVELVGLTQQVIDIPSSERSAPALIEVKDRSVLVQVKEFKDATTPPLSEIREKVLAQYRQEESVKLAEKKANDLLKLVKEAPKSFSQEATKSAALLSGPFTFLASEPPAPTQKELTPEMRRAVTSVASAGTVLPQVFRSGTSFSVVEVTKVEKPNPDLAENKNTVAKYRDESAQVAAQEMQESTLAFLKARARIDQNAALLGNDAR